MIEAALAKSDGMVSQAAEALKLRRTTLIEKMKKLMIDHAFACGFRRIEFCVDVRNKRSAAAVLKLGAKLDGTLRKNTVTWTGHVRDTHVFGLLQEHWNG